MPSILAVFTNRRAATMLLLGFSSGLPLALTSGTLQAWMTVEGLDIKTIGFFTLVGQAYVFKFAWAPLMDRYAPRLAHLGRRRGWLLVTQLALAGLIAMMGSTSPAHALGALAVLAVLVAFGSASQDIVFDAYRTDVLPASERGAGAALSVLGYRLAMIVSGGLALWLADHWLGWRGMYWLMAGLMGVGLATTLLLAPEPTDAQRAPRTLDEAIVAPWKQFFSRRGALAFLVLIVLYKLGDAFAGALTTAFLIRGVGFSAGEVGLVNKSFGLATTIIGALVGGALMSRIGLVRSLLSFGLLQLLSNLAYWALAVTPKNLGAMAAAVGIENLCGGMGTAAFVALLMALCDKRYSATQYALLSALASVGRVYVGPVSGWLVEGGTVTVGASTLFSIPALGWPGFFLATVAIGVPGVLLLWFMRGRLHALDTSQSSQNDSR